MNSVVTDDQGLNEHLGRVAPDGILSFTLGAPEGPPGGELRGVILAGTRLVNEARLAHGLGMLETYVLGQAYLGAGLAAAGLKGRDSISVRMDCEGPAQGFSVEGRSVDPAPGEEHAVEIRGYLFPDAIVPDLPLERLDTAPLVRGGSLSVARFIAGAPRPFTGTVSLRTGRLAEDLAAYYLESEQTRSALALGIHFAAPGALGTAGAAGTAGDAGGAVVAGAGGLLLQALPGATESSVERAEAAILAMPSLALRLAAGAEPEAILAAAFSPLGLVIRGRGSVRFLCRCSRERFASFIASSKGGLLEELIEEGPWPAEAKCHNCGSAYLFDKAELEAMRDSGHPAGAAGR